MVEPKDPVLLEYLSDGRIAIITLNRPQANNRLNGVIGARLTEILQTLDASLSIRAVILTGAGDVFPQG
jgi:enoyl-CoA hydratase